MVRSESGGLFAGWIIGVGPKGGCRALEFTGLWVEALPKGTRRNCRWSHWAMTPAVTGVAMRHGAIAVMGKSSATVSARSRTHGSGDAMDLHPAFQNGALLLPEVIDAPPALQVT